LKIRFIYPRFEKFLESRKELGELAVSRNTGNFMMPPALGIPLLKAITPKEHECFLFDENLEEIDYHDDADLIAVSFFTPQAEYAYKIAEKFRSQGKTVIGGGMHPSTMPEEAMQYFDSICVGEAENVWLQILEDHSHGQLKKLYKGSYPDLGKIPIPDRSIYLNNPNYDWGVALIQSTRGCKYNCSGCILPEQCGRKFRFRPVDHVISEIKTVGARDFYFIDDTLVMLDDECSDYASRLFEQTALLNPKPRIFLSVSLSMSTKPEFLKSLKDSGVFCMYTVCGSDPVSIKAFQKSGKRYFDMGVEVVNRFRDAGLDVFLSQGFGYDFQDQFVFDGTLEFIEKARIGTAEFFIHTPYPGSHSWREYNKQNRILHRNWTKYNSANVVFKPKHFTEDELLNGYLYCWKEFYSDKTYDKPTSIFTKLNDEG
jgi:radical SAM superfamily enzyme YgiQ (UPF0313 family)